MKKVKTSISTKLLRILLPMVIVTIVFIILFLSLRARKIITDTAKEALAGDSGVDAAEIGNEVSTLIATFDQFVETLETVSFDSVDAMNAYLEPSLHTSSLAPNGIYGGLEDGTWIDPSGWVPDDDYVIVERDWYILGKNSESFVFGAPYVDSDTKSMVVSASRKVTLKDGRSGVMSVDISLDEIVAETAQYNPMGYGVSMLMDGDFILSYYVAEFNGTHASEHSSDEFLNQVTPYIGRGNNVYTISNGGDRYLVALTGVPGTSWTLISSVGEGDILRELNTFQMICWIIMAAAIVIIAIVMLQLTKKIITIPVKRLTEDIERITNGDFTVTINTEGNDEISVMNQCMSEYVDSMRQTLGDMQNVTNRLTDEARSSQNTSSDLNRQAAEQSDSMSQIRDTMSGISDSVTELADNATTLAGAVSSLTDKGSYTNATMSELLKKAEQGHKDMELLKSSMAQVEESMSSMNDVVVVVDESAKKINSILEMINSISSQTNLLSLNASIEAARAGEAGRGFAVVADEIGSLANESASATTKISEIIHSITDQIEMLSQKSRDNMEDISKGTEAVSTAGETFAVIFKDLDEASKTVEDMIGMMGEVSEIATSVAAISEEQSASTIEVTETVEQVVESAGQVADESRDVDQSAQTVAESAMRIGDFVNNFRIGTN